MDSNYYSNINNNKSVNSNAIDNNSIPSLNLVKNVFFHIMFERIQLRFLFLELGNLFQFEGPIYKRLFCLIL